jgi:modification methylase
MPQRHRPVSKFVAALKCRGLPINLRGDRLSLTIGNREDMAKNNGNGHKSGTKTTSFGSPGRFGHDSSRFYASRLYEGITVAQKYNYVENPLPEQVRNKIFCKSSENMAELPDKSVHLAITSPPYNVGKDYDEDLSLSEYRDFLKRVFRELYRVLVPGGRFCLNIANLGRSPYVPLNAYLALDLIECGFLMRGEIIWDKGASASRSTAWGSWASPSNPTLRDVHEYILVFSKEGYRRQLQGRPSTITREDFLSFTKSVWSFNAEPAKKTGHPAPFPVELPRRCIELYSAADDVVLDPFIGAGATAVAAVNTKRRYVGYETEQAYCELAERRLERVAEEHSNLPLPEG